MSLRNSNVSSLCLAITLLLALNSAVLGKPPSDDVIQLLPQQIGGFRLVGEVRPSDAFAREGLLGPQAAGQRLEADRHYSSAEADYLSSENSRLFVEVVHFPGDSDAYSLLTIAARSARDPERTELGQITRQVGTASVTLRGGIAFFKGTRFVRVTAREPATQDPNNMITLARLISDRIEKGEGDLPVPSSTCIDGGSQGRQSLASVRSRSVFRPTSTRPGSSEGDAYAMPLTTARQFIMVEYNNRAGGVNDRSILAKIERCVRMSLVTSAYRRVGNIHVCFNAADEQTQKSGSPGGD